uniref:Flavonoid 3`5`-hydroxylase n=1 Tax=Billardiera heterophylla TaxID=46425 RepID=U3LXJ8_9APIA|nr:flavonoid 3`5`-hydroxylase [Billardiera heterophylla]
MATTLEFILCFTITALPFLYCILNMRILLNRHPRSLPPGPRPWPIVGNLPHLGTKPHHSIAAMARKYGPLLHLRMGIVHVVVAASADVAAQFLKNDANFSSRPPNSGAKHMAYNYHDMVFAPYGPRWRMLRKICALHIFSAKALDDFHRVREEEVAILARTLAHAGQKPVNLGQLFSTCNANALSVLMLGRRLFSTEVDSKAYDFKQMVVELMTLAGEFNVSDFIPPLEWLDLQGVAAKMKNVHNRFDAFLNVILEEHKLKLNNSGHGEQKHMDLLSTLILLKDDADSEGGKLTDTEIKALLLNLFSAGTDTSSSTIEWVIAELIRNPKILAQAQRELDLVVGPNRLVTDLDLKQLTYLQAIVKETFRLHPATPLSLPRIATESCEINGFYIPKGSTLLVNIWAIGRDPNTWAEPLVFRPERFLSDGESPNVDVKGRNFELIPFGAGRRICAGMNFGLRMVQLVTATLIHAFNWELPEGELPENMNMEEDYGISLQRTVPLVVHPKPRLDHEVYQSHGVVN